MQIHRASQFALALVGLLLTTACAPQQGDRQATSRSEAIKRIQGATNLDVLESSLGNHRADISVRFKPELSNPDSAFAILSRASSRFWDTPAFAENIDTIAITVANEVKAGLIERNTYFFYRSAERARSK